jgi:hypothetical protein
MIYKRIILRGLELSGVKVTSILGPAALAFHFHCQVAWMSSE